MTGTEFRYLLGATTRRPSARERRREGLLALCQRKAIPIFVGAPADGSVFLNSMKLWALREAAGDPYALRARPARRGLRVLRLPPLGPVRVATRRRSAR